MRSGPAIVLTRKGYKEHHRLVIPPSTTSVISLSHHCYTMPSSSCIIPSTQNQFSIGQAAVCVRGQTGNRTNAGHAITLFMFNKEGYCVSIPVSFLSRELIIPSSMLVTRTALNTLRHWTSIIVPIPMTQIKMGSKTFIAVTLFTPSVGWHVAS